MEAPDSIPLLHPAYFPVPAFFSLGLKGPLLLEGYDNYQKQTFRNRTHIYSPNGLQKLTVPIEHNGINGRQRFRDVRVDNSFNWRKQHWKSLETAYRTSPFFEYYEDEVAPFFHKSHEFLYDMNLESITLIAGIMGLSLSWDFTESYTVQPAAGVTDYRNLVSAKQINLPDPPEYTQVFGEKHGFIPHLSILDLLFNEGPSATAYLESISL